MFAGGFREFEEDPFFRAHFDRVQQVHASMNQMMRGFGGVGLYGDPFTPRVPSITHHPLDGNRQVALQNRRAMDPFGGLFDMGGMMGGMMTGMQTAMREAQNNPDSHFYTQSTVMSFSNTGNGPANVYQASSSTHQAPGGVRETRRAVRDTSRGIEKMAIGHHIRDRAHVIERSRNARSGEEEENQELINLDEEERDSFDQEFREKMGAGYGRRGPPGAAGGPHHALGGPRHRPAPRALTQEPHSSSSNNSPVHHRQRQQPQQQQQQQLPHYGGGARHHPYRRTPPPPAPAQYVHPAHAHAAHLLQQQQQHGRAPPRAPPR